MTCSDTRNKFRLPSTSQLSMAEDMAAHYCDDLCYAEGAGWLRWTGYDWENQAAARAQKAAIQVCAQYSSIIYQNAEKTRDANMVALAEKVASHEFIEGVRKLAAMHPKTFVPKGRKLPERTEKESE